MKNILIFLKDLLIATIIVFIFFFYIFGIQIVDNSNMHPRISYGDLILYYRLESEYTPGDIITFSHDKQRLTGRIIALPGDTVEITNDSSIIINNNVHLESDIYYETSKIESDITYPITLKSDEYFILGDYRDNSIDSRYFGPLNIKSINGKVITIIRRNNL